MTVKDNQPRLLEDLTTFFRRPPGPHQDLRCVQDTTQAHGRLETRTRGASADVHPYLDWPGVEQALCLERRRFALATGEISTEIVYGRIRVAPDQLDLAKVLTRWRGHWGIENRDPGVRDVIRAEARCRLHHTTPAQVLAALRNAVLSLCHALGTPTIKDPRRHFALTLDPAFSFVCRS